MYIDLIILINFLYDFIILYSVNVILKRNKKIKNILFGSIIGLISMIILFVKINFIFNILIKLLLSIAMVVITFGIKDIKYIFNNLIYFYVFSILLGGMLYFLKINLINNSILFFDSDIKISYLLLVIISPIIIYIYIKERKERQKKYDLYYKTTIILDDLIINTNGFLDTGNFLKTPYKGRQIILCNNRLLKKYLKTNYYFLVPIETINNKNMIKCIKPKKVLINDEKVKNVVIGYTEECFNIDGVEVLLNNKILEDI